jgi:intein/homing endonuclease
MRVVFTGGYDLICTPYHKFLLPDGTRVDAKDLSTGQEIMFSEQPVVEGDASHDIDNAELRGFYKNVEDCVMLSRASV